MIIRGARISRGTKDVLSNLSGMVPVRQVSQSRYSLGFAKQLHRRTAARCFSAALDGRLAFSKSSLGLDRQFIVPALDSIRQLPEVETAWNAFPSKSSIDNLKRAAEVFSSFNKGGSEHVAVCSMLAESQQRLGLYDDSLKSLDEVNEYISHGASTNIPHAQEELVLAKAKVAWTMGDFDQSQQLCESIVFQYNDLNETFPATNLHMASAMTGKALSHLAAMGSLEDAFTVRDYFRIALKFLERHPSANSLPLAAAHSNSGAAEAVYNLFLEETNNVTVPMDAALRVWFQGLQKTERDESEETLGRQLGAASRVLQSNIQANLAWAVLNYEKDRSDHLKKASDYAKQALQSDDSSEAEKEGLCRTLTVVAACYHEAGSAVTAEGLFQSAIDRNSLPAGPLPLLELRDAHLAYANLCKQWEKRESDAQRLEEQAQEIDASLPPGWQGKSGIHGSLWFWTPADFL